MKFLYDRMTKSSGYDELMYPKPGRIDLHQNIMLAYLTNAPKIRSELGRLLQRIAIDNTVIVSTVNKGQSELLMNFVCSARSRGFDLSNFILFPTDEYSKNIAEKMGIATYYAEEVCCFILLFDETSSFFGTHCVTSTFLCLHLLLISAHGHYSRQ